MAKGRRKAPAGESLLNFTDRSCPKYPRTTVRTRSFESMAPTRENLEEGGFAEFSISVPPTHFHRPAEQPFYAEFKIEKRAKGSPAGTAWTDLALGDNVRLDSLIRGSHLFDSVRLIVDSYDLSAPTDLTGNNLQIFNRLNRIFSTKTDKNYFRMEPGGYVVNTDKFDTARDGPANNQRLGADTHLWFNVDGIVGLARPVTCAGAKITDKSKQNYVVGFPPGSEIKLVINLAKSFKTYLWHKDFTLTRAKSDAWESNPDIELKVTLRKLHYQFENIRHTDVVLQDFNRGKRKNDLVLPQDYCRVQTKSVVNGRHLAEEVFSIPGHTKCCWIFLSKEKFVWDTAGDRQCHLAPLPNVIKTVRIFWLGEQVILLRDLNTKKKSASLHMYHSWLLKMGALEEDFESLYSQADAGTGAVFVPIALLPQPPKGTRDKAHPLKVQYEYVGGAQSKSDNDVLVCISSSSGSVTKEQDVWTRFTGGACTRN